MSAKYKAAPRSIIGILTIAAAVSLAVIWFLNYSTFATKDAFEQYRAEILALLPPSDQTECETEIGGFLEAPDLPISHMEGAVAKTDRGFTTISGFSHYIKRTLLASARVDYLPSGTLEWLVESEPSPIIASHIQGTSEGNNIWVAGGFIGQHPGIASRDVWILNTLTGKWKSGPKLPTARASGALVHAQGKIHYISGLERDRQTDLSEHLALDLENPTVWKQVSSFPRPRNHFQAVAIGQLIYTVGGLAGHDKSKKDLPFLDVYHPSLNKWIPLADLPESRSHAELATFVFDNRILVAGGRTEANPEQSLDSLIEYNPYNNSWRKVGQLPAPRYSPFANVIDGQFYVGGGGVVWKEPRLEAWTAPIRSNCE